MGVYDITPDATAQPLPPVLQAFATYAALRAFDASNLPSGTAVWVASRTAVGDGAEGVFFFDAASAAANNNGTILEPDTAPPLGRWVRQGSASVDVAWFGATGDGVTNDSAAIQAAVTASNGLPVTFTPGATYLVVAAIVPPSGARIELSGATILVQTVAAANCWGFNLDTVNDVEIRGGAITGQLGNGIVPQSGFGVYVTSSTNVTLKDLDISLHWYDGVFIAYASANVVQERVNAHHNRRAGCSVIGGNSLIFRDGFYVDTGHAAAPEGGEFGINIEVDGVGGAVDGVLVDNCELSRNGTVGNGTGAGFTARKGVGGSRPQNIRLVGCRVESNLETGINFDLADGIKVSECIANGHNGAIVGGASQYAIGAANSTGVQVLGNRGADNSRFIFVAGCDDGVQVVGNEATGRAAQVMGDDYDGITVRNQGVPTPATVRTTTVSSNIMMDFGGHGISINNASSANVIGNTSRNNGQHGFYFANAPNGLASGNLASGNGRQTAATYSDVYLDAGCDKFTATCNVCRYHDKYVTGTVQPAFSADWVIFEAATTNANFTSDWFVGAPLYLTGGTGIGQFRDINSYDAATRKADVNAYGVVPDASTAYAVRFANIVHSSVRVVAGSTGVRVVNNDVRDDAAISDAGTASVIANNTPGDFGAQPIVTTSTVSTTNAQLGSGYLSVGANAAGVGSFRAANGFQFYACSSAGTPRVLFELANLSASRFTLDIAGTAAGVAGVRIFGNGAVILETSSNSTALGFFGTAPVTKPAVAGSRGGNAALASLLTSLANLGLVTDGSTP